MRFNVNLLLSKAWSSAGATVLLKDQAGTILCPHKHMHTHVYYQLPPFYKDSGTIGGSGVMIIKSDQDNTLVYGRTNTMRRHICTNKAVHPSFFLQHRMEHFTKTNSFKWTCRIVKKEKNEVTQDTCKSVTFYFLHRRMGGEKTGPTCSYWSLGLFAWCRSSQSETLGTKLQSLWRECEL